MKTWLDWQVANKCAASGVFSSISKIELPDDMIEKAFIMALASAKIASHKNEAFTVIEMLIALFTAPTPQRQIEIGATNFIASPLVDGTGRGFYLDKNLIKLFKGTRAPAEALPDGVYFFQVQKNTIAVKNMPLECFFVKPGVFIFAVFKKDNHSFEYALIPLESNGVRFLPNSSLTPDDEKEIRDNLSNLARLCVIYANTIEGMEQSVEEKAIDPKAFSKLPAKKQAAKLKKHSLFTMRVLNAPKSNFGRAPSGNDRSGWQLEQTISVRGHFRQQRYGRENSLSKLIWIDEYQKGNGRIKPVLTVIKENSLQGNIA